jgi:hypothetical protein
LRGIVVADWIVHEAAVSILDCNQVGSVIFTLDTERVLRILDLGNGSLNAKNETFIYTGENSQSGRLTLPFPEEL